MLALAFTFPAGRYHATPWDRHVNEGAVAWPPEPWRILRSLIATWHHKVEHTGRHEPATLLRLVETLAQDLPEYHLPAASHSHTRHYMPQFAPGDTALVFDAFAAIGKDDSAVEYVEDRKGHDRRYSIATDKVAALGWAPKVSFEDGLEETVRFYVDQRTWWEPLTSRVKNR